MATDYVGFANLPNQVHRKSVKRGFEFTLMVVGKAITNACFYKTRQLMVTVIIYDNNLC